VAVDEYADTFLTLKGYETAPSLPVATNDSNYNDYDDNDGDNDDNKAAYLILCC